MHTISGAFASKDAADKAVEALKEAGVESDGISMMENDGVYLFTVSVDAQNRDAARAIVEQAGARDVTSVDGSADSIEAEEVARFRDPTPAVSPTAR